MVEEWCVRLNASVRSLVWNKHAGIQLISNDFTGLLQTSTASSLREEAGDITGLLQVNKRRQSLLIKTPACFRTTEARRTE